ncbi:hypothetical protein PRIPAC_97448 [Pristionchus pacificus]|uniref:Uncharacterized protein n=1 Tax=Pristionchus pacificus TaxID=54126 RepID=A0A2A6B2D6_PRIPA|nr:hypothetical protein PRIPAC_97448 [Pristionchus pacificus]|eukprot:PDM60035.1 hypothetical protein PRIPAC_49321 [Pristionchus pacificus]
MRMRSMRLLCVLLLVVDLSFEALPCDIDVKLSSLTDQKFRVDFFVPSLKVKAYNIIFDKIDQNKKISVKGDDCDSAQWLIQSFKLNEETHEWDQVRNVTAKFFGNGYIKFVFYDDLNPTLKDKIGVWSSEGNFWG